MSSRKPTPEEWKLIDDFITNERNIVKFVYNMGTATASSKFSEEERGRVVNSYIQQAWYIEKLKSKFPCGVDFSGANEFSEAELEAAEKIISGAR